MHQRARVLCRFERETNAIYCFRRKKRRKCNDICSGRQSDRKPFEMTSGLDPTR